MKFLETITPYLLKLLIFLQVFFAPVADSIILITVLVAIDLFTGLLKVRKEFFQTIGRKSQKSWLSHIQSKRLRDTWGKYLSYVAGLLACFFLQQHYHIELIKIITPFIVMIETKSIFENISIVTGVDFWSLLKDKLAGLSKGKKEEKTENK